MADVVNGSGGTGHKAQIDDIIVGGKTGTAQVVGDKEAVEQGETKEKAPDKYRDHGWFIAFAPKDHPKIAIACIIEHGGHGGSAAAPVIQAVMQRYFQLNPPPPEPDDRASAGRRLANDGGADADGGRRSPVHTSFRLDAVHPRPCARRHRPAQRHQRVVRRRIKTIDPLVMRQLIWIAVGTAALMAAVAHRLSRAATYAYPFYVLVVGC